MHTNTPVVTVPATAHATAVLTDWVIRELTPLVLGHAGLPDPQRLLRLPQVTATHIYRPWKLRRHVRAFEQILGQVQRHLAAGRQHRPPRRLTVTTAPAVPNEVLDAVGHLAGAVAELGSPVAVLANRTVLTAAGAITAGTGIVEPSETWSTTAQAYCLLVARIWQDEPAAQLRVDPH
ncbi:hypothetical protein [Rhodococcus pyridinivorans]|uniref:hypothetical protein n=1 Tax=Rhodococcus pyridinivorans TaxID=103816 RepID=UPI0022833628|nr:hypothetical protein [Rhodococcus pyridinivorans]WAL49875.1 hypothetical protein OQN32_28275 [Rhodococcus pyridinivorans]